MTRREEREETFLMLFESEFDVSRTADEIYETAKEGRDVEESPYVRKVLGGCLEHRDQINAMIEKYAKGWTRDRIKASAAAVMTLAVYEMLYMPDIPCRVSINEGVELIKKYDDEKARVFVNGVLNSVSRDESIVALKKPNET